MLCQTKLLENLEDVLADFAGRSKRFHISASMPRIFTKFSRKAFLLLRSLFDANEDPVHIRKISSFVDPSVLIAKMNFTYKSYTTVYNKIRKIETYLKVANYNSSIFLIR